MKLARTAGTILTALLVAASASIAWAQGSIQGKVRAFTVPAVRIGGVVLELPQVETLPVGSAAASVAPAVGAAVVLGQLQMATQALEQSAQGGQVQAVSQDLGALYGEKAQADSLLGVDASIAGSQSVLRHDYSQFQPSAIKEDARNNAIQLTGMLGAYRMTITNDPTKQGAARFSYVAGPLHGFLDKADLQGLKKALVTYAMGHFPDYQATLSGKLGVRIIDATEDLSEAVPQAILPTWDDGFKGVFFIGNLDALFGIDIRYSTDPKKEKLLLTILNPLAPESAVLERRMTKAEMISVKPVIGRKIQELEGKTDPASQTELSLYKDLLKKIDMELTEAPL